MACRTTFDFADTEDLHELSVRAGGAPDYELLISSGWFDALLEWAGS